ncbi:MAG: MaoC/PaaZ C-terminal domain-containing protein [Thermodesulfobacteriota bacterium]
MERDYYEDYHVGDVFKSPGRTITETDIILFSALTGDWHELHTNVEFAGKSQFGERIAHGWLVLSVGNSLLFRLGDHILFPKSFIAFYGIESVRFTNPVRIGDTIYSEAEIIKMEEKDLSKGLLTYEVKIKNQRDELVAVMVVKIIAGRKMLGK